MLRLFLICLATINKVLSVLDRKCINYIAIDRSHNYEEEIKQNYKRKNKYNEILNDAKRYIDRLLILDVKCCLI